MSRARTTFTRVLWLVCALPACSSEPSRAPSANEIRGSTNGDLGPLDCGMSAEGTVTIRNGRRKSVAWRAVRVEPAALFELVEPRDGIVLAGGEDRAGVKATARAQVVTPGQVVSGIVTVELDDPEAKTLELPVSFVAHGSRLEMSSTIDLGATPLGASVEGPLRFKNTGDRPLTLTLPALEPPFALNGPATLEVPPGESREASAAFMSRSLGTFRNRAQIALKETSCTRDAATIDLVATTWGEAFGITPGALDFGSASCGAPAAAPQVVTIENRGAAPLRWHAAPQGAAASRYKISSLEGTLGPGEKSEVEISVETPPSRPGIAQDKVLITVGGTERVLHISSTVRGPFIESMSGSSHTFARQKKGAVAQEVVTLLNSGNEPTTVTLTPSGNGFTASAPLTIPALASVDASVSFAANTLGTTSGSLSVAATPACQSALSIALEGKAFGRAQNMWGKARAVLSSYPAPCWTLDTGESYCGGEAVDAVPATAQVVEDLIGGRACYRDGTATKCRQGGASFVATPSLDGIADEAGYVWLDDAGKVWGGSPPTMYMTDVARLYGTSILTCALRKQGTVECWGDASYQSVLAIAAGKYGYLDIQDRVTLPWVSDARDFVLTQSWLVMVHADGTVGFREATLGKISGETLVAGLSDATEIRQLGSLMAIERASNVVHLLDFQTTRRSTVVPLADVRDVAFMETPNLVGAILFRLGDGRIFRGDGTPPYAVTPMPGYE